MKRLLIIIISSLLFASTSQAQTTEDSVKQAVTKMFTAMRTADAALLKTCFTDSAILQTIAKDKKSGEVKIKTESLKAFAEQVATMEKDIADERITFDAVKIDADLASVWTPYQFYYKGKLSHCGVNSFQLVRINGLWKIHYIIDTRRADNCK